MFVAGISLGNVSWSTSTQLPERLAPGDAFLSGFCFTGGLCRAKPVGQGLSGKACRGRLKEKDKINFEMCLCEALGVGLEAHDQD
ncbi:hypothetical protein ACFXTO_036079 [Malus domestica]